MENLIARTKVAAHKLGLLTGWNVRTSVTSLTNTRRFVRDVLTYARAPQDGRFRLKLRDAFPILTDFGDSAGAASGHYFHQDLWAARKIFAARPSKHVDVGSRIDGFIAHLLTFMEVTVIDVRPLSSDVQGLHFVQCDASSLDAFEDCSVPSLSSLHAIEHFGLGRYGDPVDPQACYRAMSSLARVLQPGGRLYFGVPIGRERLEFNAQRVFSPSTILESFNTLRLRSFSAVNDRGSLDVDVAPERYVDANFACGLFEFTKD